MEFKSVMVRTYGADAPLSIMRLMRDSGNFRMEFFWGEISITKISGRNFFFVGNFNFGIFGVVKKFGIF